MNIQPFWEKKQKKTLFQSAEFKKIVKICKTILYTFSFSMIVFSFIQYLTQPFTQHNVKLGEGLEFGYFPGINGTGDIRFDLFGTSLTSNYNAFYDTNNHYGPFLNWFVYPLAKLFLYLMWVFSLSMPQGLDVLMAMLIMISFARFITFWTMLRATIFQEKQLAHKNQLDNINKKYGDPILLDRYQKTQKHSEVSAYNKKHGLKPFAALENFFINTPIFIAFFKMITICKPLKMTNLFGVWNLSKSPIYMIFGEFLNGGWWYLILCVLIIPINFLSQKTPGFLSKRRNSGKSFDNSGSQPPLALKIQKFMPIIFLSFTFIASTGLSIYYFISSLFTILQSTIIHLFLIKYKQKNRNFVSKTAVELGV